MCLGCYNQREEGGGGFSVRKVNFSGRGSNPGGQYDHRRIQNLGDGALCKFISVYSAVDYFWKTLHIRCFKM